MHCSHIRACFKAVTDPIVIIPPVFHFDICDPDQTFLWNSATLLERRSGVAKKYGRLLSLMWSAKAWSSAGDIRTALTLPPPTDYSDRCPASTSTAACNVGRVYSLHLWLHFKAPTVTLPESTT